MDVGASGCDLWHGGSGHHCSSFPEDPPPARTELGPQGFVRGFPDSGGRIATMAEAASAARHRDLSRAVVTAADLPGSGVLFPSVSFRRRSSVGGCAGIR